MFCIAKEGRRTKHSSLSFSRSMDANNSAKLNERACCMQGCRYDMCLTPLQTRILIARFHPSVGYFESRRYYAQRRTNCRTSLNHPIFSSRANQVNHYKAIRISDSTNLSRQHYSFNTQLKYSWDQ